MGNQLNKYKYYPRPEEVDRWVESIREWADATECQVELLNDNGFIKRFGVYHLRKDFTYVKFSPKGMDEFYGYWQPAMSNPAPLLIHTPGYNADISIHPDLVSQGYNILHVAPLGYVTPDGPNENKRQRDGNWPVFQETIISKAQKGYRQWLMNCILAIEWARKQPEVIADRISFFGTSQGGAGSLLLGSIYKDERVRCIAADEPAFTNVPLVREYVDEPFCCVGGLVKDEDWGTIGLVDTISHVHRLKCPVLLTAGGKDALCPASAIKSLFELLPGTRSYNYFEHLEHGYTREFIVLVSAWFRMYA